jgi:hypothetical protein
LAVTRPDNKPPHLTPAPYVHHFDSYTLVKQLQAGGYTLPQAILAMKAIRTLLASNLDVAQAGLVSKADVENETYLFRAACSELSAEVRNNRRVADEQLRQQRTLLQHEVDILAQRLNQELLTLNDSVRGMFNDRRMAVREEQKAVESRVCVLVFFSSCWCWIHETVKLTWFSRYNKSTTKSASRSTATQNPTLKGCAGYSLGDPSWVSFSWPS